MLSLHLLDPSNRLRSLMVTTFYTYGNRMSRHLSLNANIHFSLLA